MKKNNNGFLIGFLVTIIVVLVVFIGLIVSGVVKFGDNKLSNKIEEIDDVEVLDDSKDSLHISDDDKYSSIIKEYRDAINDKEENIDNYTNVNKTMVHYYFSYNSVKFNYVYYDVDKNGSNELLISDNGNGKYNLVDLYTYDGNKAAKLVTDNCLGDRCSLSLYDNGIMYFYGAGGASHHGLDFYKIGSNGYSRETIGSYGVDISEDRSVTIMNGDKKTNYTSDDEVINSVIGNAKRVELDSLKWNSI